MIKFSVIIPNYNHAAFLKERIESVLSQSYQDYELIILDDCSTDNSRDIIEEYRHHPKVSHIVYAEKNSGSPFKQWEKGLSLAKGDWIWIAESDDVASSSFLKIGYEAVIANPSLSIFYSDCKIEVPAGSQKKYERYSEIKNMSFQTKRWNDNYIADGRKEVEDFLGHQCTINNASGCLMRKDLLKACISKVSLFRYHGDWFCYISLALQGNIYYSSQPLNTYRSYSSNLKELKKNNPNQKECMIIYNLILNEISIKDKIEFKKSFYNRNHIKTPIRKLKNLLKSMLLIRK